jgi:hypothetical protein
VKDRIANVRRSPLWCRLRKHIADFSKGIAEANQLGLDLKKKSFPTMDACERHLESAGSIRNSEFVEDYVGQLAPLMEEMQWRLANTMVTAIRRAVFLKARYLVFYGVAAAVSFGARANIAFFRRERLIASSL